MPMAMAMRSSSISAKVSLPLPSSSTHKARVRVGTISCTSKSTPISILFPASATIYLLSPLHEAKALTIAKDQIVSSLTQVEKTLDQVQQVGTSVFDSTQQLVEIVGNVLKPGFDKALPFAQQAGEQALKIASPAMSEVSKKAQEAFQSSGLNSEPVFSAAKDVVEQTGKVIEEAKPIASSTYETISTAEPTVVLVTAGALFLSYLLLPPIWSALSYNFRGYQGDLTPAQTLDLISSKNHILIDIRSEKDKDKSGVPRLPSNAKNSMVAIPIEELPSKLKSIVRNAKKVEAEIAALKISYLKRINKSANIIILDSYSDSAKTVAKTLTKLGFNKCWIVADGFSGGRGWIQSRLGTDTYNLSFAQLLSPRSFGTTSTKFLPE